MFYGIGIALVVIIMGIIMSSFQVDTGNVAIIKNFGELQNEIYDDGLHYKNPITESVVIISIRDKKVEADANAGSKDLQSVTSKVALNYSLKKDRVTELYKTVGGNQTIEDVLITPALQEAIKSTTSQYNASDLIVKRDIVKTSIEESLRTKLSGRGIIINQLNIINFSFSAQFNEIVEQKVTAEQQAMAEKNKLETVKFQAQQSIEKSKAEAEKIRIQAEAITKQGGAEYVQLQWIEKWNGMLPTTSMGDGQGVIFNMK